MIEKGEMELGSLRVEYYSRFTPKENTKFSNVMKRNSRMSAWLNQLRDKGLIRINHNFDFPSMNGYLITQKGIEALANCG